MGDLDEIPSMLHNLGYVAQYRGDYSQAMALLHHDI
jgi:Flp pilus assembly protein TadD